MDDHTVKPEDVTKAAETVSKLPQTAQVKMEATKQLLAKLGSTKTIQPAAPKPVTASSDTKKIQRGLPPRRPPKRGRGR
jgi:hypothetical protein